MRLSLQRYVPGRVTTAAENFRNSCSGTAAIEFGFIAPIMMFLFLGAVEITQAVMADRKTSQAAGVSGDLIAQAPSTTRPDLDYIQNVMNVSSFLMDPYKSQYLKLTLRSIQSNNVSASATKEIWRCEFDGAIPNSVSCSCPNTAYTLPAGLLGTTDGVIVAESKYGYHPMVFDFFMKMTRASAGGVYDMTEKLYLKPRNYASIPLQKDPLPAAPCNG
jgi:Flp pilus assembly protein TadG